MTITPLYPRERTDEEKLRHLKRERKRLKRRWKMAVDKDERAKLMAELQDNRNRINKISKKLGLKLIDDSDILE